jgi:hypothetical protein
MDAASCILQMKSIVVICFFTNTTPPLRSHIKTHSSQQSVVEGTQHTQSIIYDWTHVIYPQN